jgi:hypothetical protein
MSNFKPAIQSQYLAALKMLRRAIVQCPASLWNEETDKNRFWLLAYHAIFYTHLYLQPTENDFIPWEKARQNLNFMGTLPWPSHEKVEIGEPYTKEEILEYLALGEEQVKIQTLNLALEAPSGFDWIPLNKLELQFYTIRHVQQHTGELCERLWARHRIETGWVGKKHD